MAKKEHVFVYLAGKMTSKTDLYKHPMGTWRNEIFDKDLDYLISNSEDSLLRFGGPTIEYKNYIYRYIAPFPVDAGGHGLNYGENTHGAAPLYTDLRYEEIFNQCKEAIKHSDIVFAWIDDPTAYGTLYELGMCYAIRKPVFLAMPLKFETGIVSPQDMWFAATGADQHIYVNSLGQAWSLFVKVAPQMISDSRKN